MHHVRDMKDGTWEVRSVAAHREIVTVVQDSDVKHWFEEDGTEVTQVKIAGEVFENRVEPINWMTIIRFHQGVGIDQFDISGRATCWFASWMKSKSKVDKMKAEGRWGS